MVIEKMYSSVKPDKILYVSHSDGSAEARLRKNIHQEETDDGQIWVADEIFISRTMLTAEEIDSQFDEYFFVVPETTIGDLVEAIDILTNIILEV